jgi:polyisoprenoid-binding protein YceI
MTKNQRNYLRRLRAPSHLGRRFGPVFLVVALLGSRAAAADKIDAARSAIRIHVGKAGLFSAAGHEHWASVPIEAGEVDYSGAAFVRVEVDAGKLFVEADDKLSAADHEQVQRNMQTKVLESERFQAIRFRSTTVQKLRADAWLVAGDLDLHGVTRPVRVQVTRSSDGVYTGRFQIKQTDFGIQPITVGGGLVKVKNELDIEFHIAFAAQ